jgi:hypothetical protein
MARMIGRLLSVGVNSEPKGMHPDGGGLYPHANAAGARSWKLRFMLDGHAREMGLGPLTLVPLKAVSDKVEAPYRRRRLVRQAEAVDERMGRVLRRQRGGRHRRPAARRGMRGVQSSSSAWLTLSQAGRHLVPGWTRTERVAPSAAEKAAELSAALTLKPASRAREDAEDRLYISWLAACQENAARDNPAGVGETNKGEQVSEETLQRILDRAAPSDAKTRSAVAGAGRSAHGAV